MSADPVATTVGEVRAASTGRLGRLLERNPFPILLFSSTGLLLLIAFAPSLLVGDSWLTLMAGREVVEEGLPDREALTILGRGVAWTDQQWLAQVLFYATHWAAGIRGVVLTDVVLVLLALGLVMGAARWAGATARSTFLVGLLAAVAGPWGWTVRAQAWALPLFAGVLWLLLDGSRGGVRPRTLLTLPLIALWANLHGSVVLGAGLTALLGVIELVRARGARPLLALALVVLAPLCVLASPYATRLPAYYHLMLVDAPIADVLREWEWSKPAGTTVLFYTLAALTVLLAAVGRSRRRLTVFELLVLAITLVSAVQAIRGVIWFALAAAAILPVALDALIRRPDVEAPRLNRAISVTALVALAATFTLTAAARPTSWYLSDWPGREVAAVRAIVSDQSVRVFATDRHSDWLLWHIPSLRGRIAFDVRFELYDRETLEDIVRYNGELTDDWKSITDGYQVVILDREKRGAPHLEDFLAEPGTEIAYEDDQVVVLTRRGAS